MIYHDIGGIAGIQKLGNENNREGSGSWGHQESGKKGIQQSRSCPLIISGIRVNV
jgi:hypothetical protein